MSSFPAPIAPAADSRLGSRPHLPSQAPTAALAALTDAGLLRPGAPLRLHLGCGEQRFLGYVNVDYPPAGHNVMQVAADAFADITQLELPAGSVDEVRLHHVFEHFSRVAALGLLIRWQRWLKPGGTLRIETPDLLGCARVLIGPAPTRVKMGIARHLAGDHAAGWAYHLDHWFEERFVETLTRLGFTVTHRQTSSWPHEPYLANVEVLAEKSSERTPEAQLAAAEELLWQSTVAAEERPTWEIWRQQLRAFLAGGPAPRAGAPEAAPTAPAAPPVRDEILAAALAKGASKLPLPDIHDFNQKTRDAWMADRAREIPAGARVLDVGAGTCPYRALFAHCRYEAHDFKRYTGVKLGGTNQYGRIDHESDITAIPVADGSYDVVVCTEVLEHVPEPIEALREMARLVRPGGRLLLTAPLGSGLHQLPFHFYGGYTPEWYRHFAARFGLEVADITPNGGFYRLLAQECARVAWMLPEHAQHHGAPAGIVNLLFGEWLPRYLFGVEERCRFDGFTVGYHVELRKPGGPARAATPPAPPVSAATPTTPQATPASLTPAPATTYVGPAPQPAPIAAPVRTRAIVFSKDRPLQLQATLASFQRQCVDADATDVCVLYAVSSDAQRAAYAELAAAHPEVRFVAETDFRRDLLALVAGATTVLLVVDDTLFVQPFSLAQMRAALAQHADAIGFSLRLGRNTTYCYPLDRDQHVPTLQPVGADIVKYDWRSAEHDFGYPLEVSSSLYRSADLAPLLEATPFHHPNSLEERIAGNTAPFQSSRPALLCFERSVAFAAPLNRVQATHPNRAASDPGLSAGALLDRFRRGERIDVAAYAGFVPRGCHQEVDLRLVDYQPCLAEVERLLENQQLAAAIAAIEAFLERAPHHPAASHDLAVLCLAAGRADDAEAILAAAVSAHPAAALPRRALAEQRAARGDVSGALALLAPLLTATPPDADAVALAEALRARNSESRPADPARATWWTDCVPAGALVFDVGAHQGDKAADFLAHGARVVAFEPQPACHATLARRFAATSGLTVVGLGLSDRHGHAKLSVCTAAPTISTLSEEWKAGRFADYRWDAEVDIELATLDEMIAAHGLPHYVKIDVEGHELPVLQGLSQPVPLLSFEFTKEFRETAARCLEHLVRLGYRRFNLALGEEKRFHLPAWFSASDVVAFIGASTDPTLWGDIYALAG